MYYYSSTICDYCSYTEYYHSSLSVDGIVPVWLSLYKTMPVHLFVHDVKLRESV